MFSFLFINASFRLRAARVLLIGVGGIGAEVAKNIVLAGIRSLTLLDHRTVTVEDSTSQFLVERSHVGQNRASSSRHRTQLLNPMVEVKAETENSESKSEEYFKLFDVVCATCCTLDELLRLDDICRRNNIAFFAGDVFGYFGFMFADLHEHEYAEDVVAHGKQDIQSSSGEPPVKKMRVEDDQKKTVKKASTYVSLKSVVDFDWSLNENSKRLRLAPKTYFIVRVLLEFRAQEGRDPDSQNAEDDRKKLQDLCAKTMQKIGVPADHVDQEVFSSCAASLSPVCAITGGILAQEIIKAVSKRDAPHNNFFFYNGIEFSGLVDQIG